VYYLGGGGRTTQDPAAMKLKSAESWFKIFGAMTTMHQLHQDNLTVSWMLTAESEAFVELVSSLDVL